MTRNHRTRTGLPPGDRVCVFAGPRVHSPRVRIPVGEICTVAELPSDGQPGGAVPAVAIRRPSGDVLLVDVNVVRRVGA